MIYYPLSVLMLAGIRDIMLISTPHDIPRFQELLGTGEQWGLNLAYAVQPSPDGLAQALIIGSEFVGNGPCALILGDNIFYGHQLSSAVQRACGLKNGATVFAYPVKDPERYGVVSFDDDGKARTLEEKPAHPRSRYAVTGLYFYDQHAAEYARSLQPSSRGELEITDLNRIYLEQDALNVELLGRGTAWLDTGTHESLLQASVFIETLEARQGMKICCPEEIAFRMGYIGMEALAALASELGKSTYGNYLRELVAEHQSDAP
jgi:glucose-1-phosphate thymidylyltransferase